MPIWVSRMIDLRIFAAVTILALSALVTPVHAGSAAWGTFVQVCLSRMAEFEPVQTSGLAAIAAPDWVEADVSDQVFAGPRGHVIVVSGAGVGQPYCGVAASGKTGTDLAAAFGDWSQAARDSGTYEQSGNRLESLIHEPRIAVEFQPGDGASGPVVRVTETDKES